MTASLRARAAHLARATLATPRHVHRARCPACCAEPTPWSLRVQKYKGDDDDGAKCMFNCFTCGTDFTFVVQSVDGDGVTFHKYTDCGGILYGSPCPCLG